MSGIIQKAISCEILEGKKVRSLNLNERGPRPQEGKGPRPTIATERISPAERARKTKEAKELIAKEFDELKKLGVKKTDLVWLKTMSPQGNLSFVNLYNQSGIGKRNVGQFDPQNYDIDEIKRYWQESIK